MGNQFGKDKKPKDLNDLLQTIKFTEEEIIAWYKNFLKVNLQIFFVFELLTSGGSFNHLVQNLNKDVNVLCYSCKFFTYFSKAQTAKFCKAEDEQYFNHFDVSLVFLIEVEKQRSE